MHEVLVNRLGGLSLPRKSVVRLTDRPDMTLDVYRGRKITIQYNTITNIKATSKLAILFLLYKVMELHMICKRHEIKTGRQLSYQEMRVISKVSTTCRTQFICQDPYQ